MPRTPVTARDVTKWLKNNPTVNNKPTRIPDGVRATGYKGPPLKTKEGNLEGNRGKLRLAKRGENGDHKRKVNGNLRKPINAEERNRNRRQNYKRSSLNKQGRGRFVVDHKIPLDRLGETVEGKTKKQADQRIKELEQVYGPLGDRPGNRQIISKEANEQKRQDEAAVQKRLGEMEAEEPSSETSRNKFETPNPNPAFQSRYAQNSYQHAQDSLKLIGTVGAVGLNVLSVLKALNPLQFNP